MRASYNFMFIFSVIHCLVMDLQEPEKRAIQEQL